MRTRNRLLSTGFAVVLGVVSAPSLFADTVVQAPSSTLPRTSSSSLSFPALFGIPTAVAPRRATIFSGLTYANPRGGVSGSGGDGDFSAGYSLGNPLDGIGLTLGLVVTGLDPFGDAGSFSLTASRLLRAEGNSATFAGASVSNLFAWGVNSDRSEMYSAYVSHLIGLDIGTIEIPIQVTIGYGTDNTASSDGSGRLSDGVFAGVGVGLSEVLSVGLSGTRTQLNIGATLNLPGLKLSPTFGVFDVTDNTGRRQFSLSVGYSF